MTIQHTDINALVQQYCDRAVLEPYTSEAVYAYVLQEEVTRLRLLLKSQGGDDGSVSKAKVAGLIKEVEQLKSAVLDPEYVQWLYKTKGLSQNQIAAKLMVSRGRVRSALASK